MNTPEWIEYTGSDEQYSAIITARNGFMLRDKFFKFMSPIFRKLDKDIVLSNTEYLICQPHPYADLIKIWADTGCPVWVKYEVTIQFPGCSMNEMRTHKTNTPDWNIPGVKYSLTPFED